MAADETSLPPARGPALSSETLTAGPDDLDRRSLALALTLAERPTGELGRAGGRTPSQAVTQLVASLDAAARTGEAPELRLEAGESVGRYLVLARLGAGGMGVVYAAYDPELDRKVALKLLRWRHGDEADGRSRLLREAQAMARLQHPNVVAVFDVGSLDGHVWVAMEFVDGAGLSTWAAGRPWRDVLEAMCSAGRGLAAAHAAGLVHRDVKPDNIMVDADGRVRLMDFGLARSGAFAGVPAASDAPLTVSAAALDHGLTLAGALLGTPAYMAPEQFSGLPADARSDQFGWCVACWEVLHGARPFAGDTLPALQLAVTTGELRPPPAGSAVPPWVRRVLTRGLSTDPAERFATMDDLLAELARGQARPRRWLRGLALLAALVGAASARQLAQVRAAEACEAAGAATEPLWNPAVRERLRAAFTRESPRLGATALARTTGFLDRFAAEWQATRVAVCREATIERTRATETAVGIVACLEERRTDLEAVLDVLAEADAEVVQRAAHLVSGLMPARACLADARARRAGVDEDAAERARTVALRRRLVRAIALEDAGKFAAGLALAHGVRLEAERMGQPLLLAEANMRIGNLHERSGRFAEAERTLEEAVFLAAGVGHDETVAEAASMLAFAVGYRLARLDDALRWARLAEAALLRAGATESLRAARLHSVLGTVHRLHGDLDAALAHSRRAVELRESLLGPEHPDLARSLNTLGNVALARGDHELALRCHGRALELRERAYGRDVPDVATSLKNLGDAQLAAGALAEALRSHGEALALRERLLGPAHPDVASALIDLGRTHRALGDHAAAWAAFERAATLREQTGQSSLALAEALQLAGEAALALDRPADAAAALERALVLTGDDPPSERRARALAALAQAQRAQGQDASASATARAAHDESARARRSRERPLP